jgi:hypothetical protein
MDEEVVLEPFRTLTETKYRLLAQAHQLRKELEGNAIDSNWKALAIILHVQIDQCLAIAKLAEVIDLFLQDRQRAL